MYTLAQLQEIISDNLGLGRIDVELDANHFKRGTDAALKLLARFHPQHGYQVIPVMAGGLKAKLTAKNIQGVSHATFFSSGTRLEEAPYYTRWVDRMMELGDMKDTQRIFGDTPEWKYQFERDPATPNAEASCWFYYTITRSTFIDTFARIPNVACLEFLWSIEASDDLDVGVSRIPLDMQQWVEDYATARCRLIMASVRGKFGGVPGGDDGSLMPTDAPAQMQMARDDIKNLEKDLQDRARQLPIYLD